MLSVSSASRHDEQFSYAQTNFRIGVACELGLVADQFLTAPTPQERVRIARKGSNQIRKSHCDWSSGFKQTQLDRKKSACCVRASVGSWWPIGPKEASESRNGMKDEINLLLVVA